MKVPAILQSKKKIKTQVIKPEFTQSEVQRLHSATRKFLKDLNFFKSIMKIEINDAWDKSIPDTEDGAVNYERLNGLRAALQDLKTQEKNFIQIQRKLKKMMS